MQAVWIGHSFSYKVDKNYSEDVPGHILILFFVQWSPQIAIAMSPISCLSILSMMLGTMQV